MAKSVNSVAPTDETMRSAMRRLASGVSVVTISNRADDAGLTVSSTTSISLAPPIVMVALDRQSRASELATIDAAVAIHFLSSDQKELSVRFSRSIPWIEKTDDVPTRRGASGAVLLGDVSTILEGTISQLVQIGTHDVLFINVSTIHISDAPPASPLVYFDRDYRTLDRR